MSFALKMEIACLYVGLYAKLPGITPETSADCHGRLRENVEPTLGIPVDGRILLKWIINEHDVTLWAGLVQFRIG